MPYLSVRTSAPLPADPTALLNSLSRELAAVLGKKEESVLADLDADRHMTIAGSDAASCIIDVAYIGQPSEEQMSRVAGLVTERLSAALKVPGERVFVRLVELDREHWAQNGTLFSRR